MITLKGKIKNGQVVLDYPADLPDNTEVIVTPGSVATDDDGPMSPEEIARLLAAMETVEPFELTPQEEAEIETARRARKEREKVQFEERAQTLQRMWE